MLRLAGPSKGGRCYDAAGGRRVGRLGQGGHFGQWWWPLGPVVVDLRLGDVGVVDDPGQGGGNRRQNAHQQAPHRGIEIGLVGERTALLLGGEDDAVVRGDDQHDLAVLVAFLKEDQGKAARRDASSDGFLLLFVAVHLHGAELVGQGDDDVAAGLNHVLSGAAPLEGAAAVLGHEGTAHREQGHQAGGGAGDGLDVAVGVLVELGEVELERGLAVLVGLLGLIHDLLDVVLSRFVGISAAVVGADGVDDLSESEFHN